MATQEAFLPTDEQQFFDSVVHGLRSAGWSRTEAEDEALSRIEAKRQRDKRDFPLKWPETRKLMEQGNG